ARHEETYFEIIDGLNKEKPMPEARSLRRLSPNPRQRPVLDRLWRCQRAQEITEVVGERMKLEPHRIGGERSARQSRPLDRAFALLDPLLARPALVVESKQRHPCRRASSGRKPWSEFALGLLFARFEISFDPIQAPIERDHVRS